MQAKGKAKAKGKAFTGSSAVAQTKQHEGALDNSYFVQSQMKNGKWLKAKIIECRLSKDYDAKCLSDRSYDYYVHYEGYDRRMDEWVVRDRIQMTDEEVVEEPMNKKKVKENQLENDEHEGMDAASVAAHMMNTRVKLVENIEFGNHKCETWYYSPFPAGYQNVEYLYICEFCLLFYTDQQERIRHQQRCALTKLGHPPGDEIYRDTERQISMFEVDGHKNPIYCENLCYISKLFLDHKNLEYDVEPFLFFILTEYNETGFHLVGYFSKEKDSQLGYNLSCILTLPFHQRKGYGKFLISMSYQLSMIEGKVGTPERPLSDLGRESYLSWWIQTIIDYLRANKNQEITLGGITKATGMNERDILWTLEQKQMIKYQQSTPIICLDQKYLDDIYQKAGRPGFPVHQELIHWAPYKKIKKS